MNNAVKFFTGVWKWIFSVVCICITVVLVTIIVPVVWCADLCRGRKTDMETIPVLRRWITWWVDVVDP